MRNVDLVRTRTDVTAHGITVIPSGTHGYVSDTIPQYRGSKRGQKVSVMFHGCTHAVVMYADELVRVTHE